eukprot:134487-Pleurochrysis_carterae.AAC.1
MRAADADTALALTGPDRAAFCAAAPSTAAELGRAPLVPRCADDSGAYGGAHGHNSARNGAKSSGAATAQLRIYSSLLNKRRLTAQRSLCTTCCQLLFPVLLVFFALLLLSANISFVGPKLSLSPHDAFAPSVSQPVDILLADNAASAFLAKPLAAHGWSPAELPQTSDEFP